MIGHASVALAGNTRSPGDCCHDLIALERQAAYRSYPIGAAAPRWTMGADTLEHLARASEEIGRLIMEGTSS